MRTLVISDIHGRIEALKEVLEKSQFSYESDTLILLGDLCDGGYNTYEVVEELLKIKNIVFCLGNHDEFFLSHIKAGFQGEIWLSQGGINTVRSYKGRIENSENVWGAIPVITQDCLIPVTHQDFFNRAVPFFVDDKNRLFVHGGFDARHGKTPYNSTLQELVWDRDLIEYAREGNVIEGFFEVYIGHTTTQTYGETIPLRFKNLYMVDCGAGFDGKLCLIDIDSKEFWLSKVQNPAR